MQVAATVSLAVYLSSENVCMPTTTGVAHVAVSKVSVDGVVILHEGVSD